MSIFTAMRCVILCLFSCISVINGLSRPSDQSAVRGLSRPSDQSAVRGLSRPSDQSAVRGLSRPSDQSAVRGLSQLSDQSAVRGLSQLPDHSGKVKVLAEFLITVNDTWESHGCIDTVKTPPILSEDYNNKKIPVGNCDNGPLAFQIRPGPKPYNYTLDIIFFSEVIQTAAPPTCSIQWNGAYLTPTRMDVTESLLPGCYTTDSRDGFYKTQYWFHLLTWTFQTQ